MDPDQLTEDSSYCGVGITRDALQYGMVVLSISPDSDLNAPAGLAGWGLQPGDRIIAMREYGGEWRPIVDGDSLRGPSGSLVQLRYVRPSEGLFALTRETDFIGRKRFSGDVENRLDPESNSCMQSFVEVDPAELMDLSAPAIQFASTQTQACYKG